MNAPQSSEKVKSCSKRHFYPSPPSRVPQQNIGRCPKDGGVKNTLSESNKGGLEYKQAPDFAFIGR